MQKFWRFVIMLVTDLLGTVRIGWALLCMKADKSRCNDTASDSPEQMQLEADPYVESDPYVEPDTYANTDSEPDPYIEPDPYVEPDVNNVTKALGYSVFQKHVNAYKRVGFIVKERTDINKVGVHNATGLHTSSSLTAASFRKLGVPAEVYEAHDGNSIDEIIKRNNLDVVVLEANWALPSKIAELRLLHPSVSWFVRTHSEIPFLAHEGIAWTYMQAYDSLGVTILPNDSRAMWDLASSIEHLDLLRNTYAVPDGVHFQRHGCFGTLNIGCFGAIRSLKNHMRAACAAIRYANSYGKKLRFHINSERVEGGFVAANTLKNLRALLGDSLVEHAWMTHEDFINIVCRNCDVVIVPSLSETFNVVAADAVVAGTPVVTSNEVVWLKHILDFAPNDPYALYQSLEYVMSHQEDAWEQQLRALRHWNADVIGEYQILAQRYFRK